MFKGTRKTVTYKSTLYDAINKWRGEMLIHSGMNYNFTEAVNFLLTERLFKKTKGTIFIEHIQKHIDDGDIDSMIREPMCKICGKYLSEIVEEIKS